MTLGNCVAPFSITYNRAPASSCPGNPAYLLGSQIFPSAVEAALIAILLIPAAHYCGILLARRRELSGRPALSVRALRWLTAATAAAAVVAGIALPNQSEHGTQPIGSPGQDGWIKGAGYEIRLYPNWYDITRGIRPGYALFQNDATFTGIPGQLVFHAASISPAKKVYVPGARLTTLDGERALTVKYPNLKGYFYKQWITIHNGIEYVITFQTKPVCYPALAPDLTAMIGSWRWPAASS